MPFPGRVANSMIGVLVKHREDSQGALVGSALLGALRNAARRRDEFRYHVIRDAWALLKRFGSQRVENIELRQFPALEDAVVETYIDDPNRAVLAALCRALEAKTFFEIGTNRGRTAWTVARNNPECQLFTLDLPSRESLASVAFDVNASDRDFFAGEWDRGEAFRGTPEEQQITALEGDSATFDYSPYVGQMDVVFVDGAHSYAYVKSDTERALQLVSPNGVIVWDDYPAVPGVYRYLNEFAPTHECPLYHIFGTRLVIHSQMRLTDRFATHIVGRQFAA